MDLLLLKLSLTPLLMAAVSVASRRWGGAVGGLLAGLPLTSGPVSIYLTIEQGRAFAAGAALGAIGGLGAVFFSYLVYVEASRRLSVAATGACALLSFFAASGVLRFLDPSLGLLLALNGVLLVLVLLRGSDVSDARPRAVPTAWDLPARVLISTAMVLVITLSARLIGPRFSGLLSAVPMIGWPLIVFAHMQQGRAEALAALLGIARGLPGLIAFYLAVYLLFPQTAPLFTFSAALVLSLVLTGGMAWRRRATPGLALR